MKARFLTLRKRRRGKADAPAAGDASAAAAGDESAARGGDVEDSPGVREFVERAFRAFVRVGTLLSFVLGR